MTSGRFFVPGYTGLLREMLIQHYLILTSCSGFFRLHKKNVSLPVFVPVILATE